MDNDSGQKKFLDKMMKELFNRKDQSIDHKIFVFWVNLAREKIVNYNVVGILGNQ